LLVRDPPTSNRGTEVVRRVRLRPNIRLPVIDVLSGRQPAVGSHARLLAGDTV